MATIAVTPKVRKQSTLTPEQKHASQLRRDAALLERLAAGASDPRGMLTDAAKFRAQADAIAPAKPKVATVTGLTEDEWTAVEGYFLQDIRTRLQKTGKTGAGFSLKSLKAIAKAQ